MSISLYADENVDARVVQALRDRGVDVLSVREDGIAGSADPVVLARATTLGRILYTEDRDFLIKANEMQQSGLEFLGIIFARATKLTIRVRVDDLELMAKVGAPEDFTNQIHHLPISKRPKP